MRKIILYSISTIYFIITSCGNKKAITNSSTNDEVEVIKFMGTTTTQSRSIDEKAFWFFKDEHAILKISNSGFIEDVKMIKNNNADDFEEYHYAFIVRKERKVDTLYSDYKLRTWILKKNGEKKYFYDEKGNIAENLRNRYSFFNDCW
ncbi:hypothetical protein AR687_24345 [Flavobacteriaceae bacterium CRH]|nr:hypothetical protein AR687_24345 [Flavobacteriaceae bacterium CRH]